MPEGRLEVLSADFALGWMEVAPAGRTFVYASLAGKVIEVAEATIRRPDLEQRAAATGKDSRAYLIVFRRPLTGDQVASVEIGVVGEPGHIDRTATLRGDRLPKLQVFILGSPRSGTSELGNTIAGQLGLPWLGEGHAAPLFAEASKALDGNPRSDNGLVRFMARQHFGSLAIEAAQRAYYFMHGSASFVDKTPGVPMISAAPFLLQCFPGARTIYLMRNGISNVLSRMTKFGGSFDSHCADWAAALRTWETVRSLLPHYLELRQEDMMNEPAAVAERVALYLEQPEMAGALAASLRTGSLERSGAGIGRSSLAQTGWSSEQVKSFVHLCGPTMEHFGYPMQGAPLDRATISQKEDPQPCPKPRPTNVAEVKPGHPIGHYYSPVNDISKLDRQAIENRRRTISARNIRGLDIQDAKLMSIWTKCVSLAPTFPFAADKQEGHRYYYQNPFYGIGDAFFHFCLVSTLRPRRYIEIGSGFSSACFLDTAQYNGLTVDCTFVEPYPSRLKSLLTVEDLARHRIIEKPVQDTNFDLYESLDENDILFIDSTHVAKAGSDVLFELFEILPSLRPGVVVHFHDMFWPFEYPAKWIFENRYSWNELYAVRAFLTFNNQFEILFFNDYICAQHGDVIDAAVLPSHLRILRRNCGGGLWIRRL